MMRGWKLVVATGVTLGSIACEGGGRGMGPAEPPVVAQVTSLPDQSSPPEPPPGSPLPVVPDERPSEASVLKEHPEFVSAEENNQRIEAFIGESAQAPARGAEDSETAYIDGPLRKWAQARYQEATKRWLNLLALRRSEELSPEETIRISRLFLSVAEPLTEALRGPESSDPASGVTTLWQKFGGVAEWMSIVQRVSCEEMDPESAKICSALVARARLLVREQSPSANADSAPRLATPFHKFTPRAATYLGDCTYSGSLSGTRNYFFHPKSGKVLGTLHEVHVRTLRFSQVPGRVEADLEWPLRGRVLVDSSGAFEVTRPYVVVADHYWLGSGARVRARASSPQRAQFRYDANISGPIIREIDCEDLAPASSEVPVDEAPEEVARSLKEPVMLYREPNARVVSPVGGLGVSVTGYEESGGFMLVRSAEGTPLMFQGWVETAKLRNHPGGYMATYVDFARATHSLKRDSEILVARKESSGLQVVQGVPVHLVKSQEGMSLVTLPGITYQSADLGWQDQPEIEYWVASEDLEPHSPQESPLGPCAGPVRHPEYGTCK